MAPALLHLREIELTFGGTPLLTGAELQVAPGARLCLVGRNGSGKSTLLKVAAGIVAPDDGQRFVQPGARILYLAQEPDLSAFPTTLAYAESAFGENEDPYRARLMLEALGLTGNEATATLSGGEARRAALAQVLAPEPDVLLLDEPTNHLDLPAIEWLEAELKRLRSAIVLISHDRRFLENLSRTTLWLDRGATHLMEKGFAHFEAWRDEMLEKEAEERHKLDRKIAREEDWMQGGVSGRRKRNVRRVAELAEMRKQRSEARNVTGNVQLEASEAGQSGKLVIEAKGISKTFDGGSPVVESLALRIMRGDRLGIVGPNGAGKTTLIRMLTGSLEPDSGTLRHGANLELVWLDQKREALDDDATLTDVLTGGRGDTVFVNGRSRHVATYLKEFLFQPEQSRSRVSVLSGGERARLLLARALSQPSNVMVLDEPTNDLDLETLDLLQELLADYPGTLMLVSHDRDFIDRVCTSVLVSVGEGRWTEYAGGYSDMISQRGGEAVRERAENGETGTSENSASRKTGSKAVQVASKTKRKLSFKDKHALETLPDRIAELETQVAKLQTKLEDPDLFAKDPNAFSDVTGKLSKAQGDLATAEEQWLELEMLREEIEG